MSDGSIPTDLAVLSMCDDLRKMRNGLAVMGIQAHILGAAADKLNALALEVERIRSDDAYTLGHKDGWDEAMGTALCGDGA